MQRLLVYCLDMTTVSISMSNAQNAGHHVSIAAVSMCRAIVSVTVDTIVSVTVTVSMSIDQSLF